MIWDNKYLNSTFLWGASGTILTLILFVIPLIISEDFKNNHPDLYLYISKIPLILPWLLFLLFLFLFLRLKNKSDKKWEGIEQITGLHRYIPKLEGSEYHPRKLIHTIERQLDFMGHGARKWTENKKELGLMLKTIHFNSKKGEVRFLVRDPKLEEKIEEKKSGVESLLILWQLQQEHNNFEVRVYNHIPQLRLTFYDENVVVVGHYQGRDEKNSDETPLLVFLHKCEWSFYKGFLSHFDEEFSRVEKLDEAYINEIKKLL